MPNPIIDSSFPSVLVYGTLGSIVSIATVWLSYTTSLHPRIVKA